MWLHGMSCCCLAADTHMVVAPHKSTQPAITPPSVPAFMLAKFLYLSCAASLALCCLGA